ncbi:MAG: class I SAM-dependent methyltransferase [Patescibacteria group bacterium]
MRLIRCLGTDLKNLKVVDMGCGSGNLLFEYKNHFKHGTGIDINPKAVSFVKERAKNERSNNIDAVVVDILKERLDLKEQADVVLCLDFFEHFKEEDIENTVLPRVKGIIKNKGILIVTVPNRLSYWPLLEKLLDLLKLVPNLGNEQHLTNFSKKTLSHLLLKNGFGIQQMGTFNHISPFLFSKTCARLLLPIEVKYLKTLGPLIFVIARKED